ncbi:MAG: hypothetical protein MHMPM18_003198 [Marteilia pararefringens]
MRKATSIVLRSKVHQSLYNDDEHSSFISQQLSTLFAFLIVQFFYDSSQFINIVISLSSILLSYEFAPIKHKAR